MKKLLQNMKMVFVALLAFFANSISAQTSVQDFGTGTGTHANTTGSTSFIPNPTVGTTYARSGGAASATINLVNTSNPLGTTGSYLRALASTSTSVTRVSPIVGYTGGAEFYTSFKVLFGNASGASANLNGSWTLYQGGGGMYTGNNEVVTADIFSGIRFTYGNGTVDLTTRQGSTLVATGLTTTTLNQATVYTIEIVGNNKSSGTINYNYAGNAQSVAPQRMDLYVNGTRIGNDLAVSSGYTNGNNITSMTFNGVSSTSNGANIFLDDIIVYNAIPAAINVPAAFTPNAPVVSNPTINSLDVTIDSNAQNGNGATITYAIQEAGGNYVQANGTLGASPVWQTAATWGTVTVTGLNSSTEYTFAIKARNAANVETGFSDGASGTTLDNLSAYLAVGDALDAFGSVCLNDSVTNSFTVSGNNLDGSDVVVGSLAGYTFSLTENGTYTSTLNISYGGDSFADQTVWVRFTPTLVQSYNGNIQLTGGGLENAFEVAATGSGINTAVAATTGSASGVTSVLATAAGSLAEGCSAVTAYGIEYSTTDGFAVGTGTQVSSNNLSAGAFSSSLTGLSANTTYYFRAYATDATGTVYGSQQNFTTLGLTAPQNLGSTAVGMNNFTATWDAVEGATSYAIDVKTDPFLNAEVLPWINEFHYDDNGADANEFVEIVVPAGYAGTGLTFTLYNGNGGTIYGDSPYAVTNMTLGANTEAYKIYSITFPQDGIQNGAPDGFALSDSNGLIEFLSYEGSFTATTGPADDVQSTDIGVSETNSNEGASLHKVGTGTGSADFTWEVSEATNSNTKGQLNTGQTINAAVSGTFILEDFNVGNTTSYEVTGLDPETTYYFRVRAISANSTSPNSDIEEVTTLVDPVTFGSISQAGGVVCEGLEATFNVTGLLPNETTVITYNINGGSAVSVNVAANGDGEGSFTLTLIAGNNGQTLTVTSVAKVATPGNTTAVTENNTVVLSVNAYVTYYADADDDGYGNPAESVQACDGAPEGYVADNTDCNDADATAHALYSYYEDTDGDGYGSDIEAEVCAANPSEAPAGYSLLTGDCNDGNASVHPGATEIGYNLIDDDCDGSIDEGFPPKVTVVQAGCNTTLPAIDTQIVANLVAGAQGYRWRVTPLTGPNAGQPQVFDTSLRTMKLTQLPNYAYATQYQIEISVRYAGFWQPYAPSACAVTTPTVSTQLISCGQELTSMSNVIYSNLVPFVTGYRFRVTDPLNPLNTQVIERPVREFRMNLITAFPVQFNKTYNVEVSLKNTDGTWLPYGGVCTVTTPVFPSSSLQDSQCDDFEVLTNNTQLYAISYPGAIGYVFQITGPGIVSEREVKKNVRAFTLDDFPGLIPGATYNVRVRLVFNEGDPDGPFGKVCTIVTPGLSRPAGTRVSFEATAYPNPFAGSFNINVETASSEDISVKVYDMTGRLLERDEVKAGSEMPQIGNALPSGVYNVIVSQGDNTKTLRVIKR